MSSSASIRQVVRSVASSRVVFLRFARHESGATTIEYGLICVFVLLAIIGGMQFFGEPLTQVLSRAASLSTPE